MQFAVYQERPVAFGPRRLRPTPLSENRPICTLPSSRPILLIVTGPPPRRRQHCHATS